MNNLIDIRHHKFNKDDLNEFKKHKDFEGDIDGVYKVMRVIFYNNNEPIVLDLKQAHHNRRVRNFDLNGLFLSFYEMKECLKAKESEYSKLKIEIGYEIIGGSDTEKWTSFYNPTGFVKRHKLEFIIRNLKKPSNNEKINFTEYFLEHFYDNYIVKEVDEDNFFNDETRQELNIDFEDTLFGKYGNDEVLTTIQYQNNTIESKFNDFQAFHICRGYKGKEKQLYNKYENGDIELVDQYNAHLLANNILNKMGISYVNYMLSLPTYPFYSNRLNILFDTLDHLKTTNKKTRLIFKFKNIRNINEEVEIGYLEENNNTYINQIVAKNKTTNEIMFNISRKGIIKLNDNIGTQLNRNITPVIQFFYNITENNKRLNNAILLENDIDL